MLLLTKTLVIPDAPLWDGLRALYAIAAGFIVGGLLIRMFGPYRFHYPSGRAVPMIFIGWLLLALIDESRQVGEPFDLVRLPCRIFLTLAVGWWLLRNKQVYRHPTKENDG